MARARYLLQVIKLGLVEQRKPFCRSDRENKEDNNSKHNVRSKINVDYFSYVYRCSNKICYVN